MLDIAGLVVIGTYDDDTTQTESITVENITGFDSTAVAATQTLTITVGTCTTTYDISIDKADGLPLTGVIADDTTNTISGMALGMEYSVDSGVTWTEFDPTVSPNLPDLTGTLSLMIRYAESPTHKVGAITVFNFTPLNAILPIGYETQVQTDMGVTASILSTTAIQSKATLAEALLKKAVPTYAEITGDELVFLQSACIAQLCALLCPGMSNRVKVAQQDETLYSFKIQSTNWDRKKREFESMVSNYISLAIGQEATVVSLVGVVFNDRLEI